MRFQSSFVLPCVISGTFAASHYFEGSFSSFKALSVKPDANTTKELYSSCTGFDASGKAVSTGNVCVKELLWDTLAVLLATSGGMQTPAHAVSNDTVLDVGPASVTSLSVTTPTSSQQAAASQATGSKYRRMDDAAQSALLKRVNDNLSEVMHEEHSIRAVSIGHSDIHPTDGIAIRTNVQNSGAFFHVHTNGSHATATLNKDASTSMRRRGQDSAGKHSYEFSKNMWGVKVQINKANGGDVSMSDLDAYIAAFTYGNGESEPALKESDDWKISVCDRDRKVQLLFGKVVSLQRPSDNGYERPEDWMNCNRE
ncbi:hypothetical protein WHR41_09356 [Cladosporium halotolerans]|uniref:Uncharacterized protein n=1 Tax=Cladosporium halotolerans TaxID=1052096 RepID=A0AB34K9S0_9PEZI